MGRGESAKYWMKSFNPFRVVLYLPPSCDDDQFFCNGFQTAIVSLFVSLTRMHKPTSVASILGVLASRVSPSFLPAIYSIEFGKMLGAYPSSDTWSSKHVKHQNLTLSIKNLWCFNSGGFQRYLEALLHQDGMSGCLGFLRDRSQVTFIENIWKWRGALSSTAPGV